MNKISIGIRYYNLCLILKSFPPPLTLPALTTVLRVECTRARCYTSKVNLLASLGCVQCSFILLYLRDDDKHDITAHSVYYILSTFAKHFMKSLFDFITE